ncbi:winged helix-turn-helix transcriptional regulator [Gemmata sp.]|uniref:winged helix-turn-helix transcriptional regulator n=1 Tax=Gemmata sp. TaxID=1914242 RepID=UPI003F6F088B
MRPNHADLSRAPENPTSTGTEAAAAENGSRYAPLAGGTLFLFGRATLDGIGGKRRVVILSDSTHVGAHPFAVLRRKIPGVRERILTPQLHELEAGGFVHREDYDDLPPEVEYPLADSGKTLCPISEVTREWACHTRGLLTDTKRSAA